MDEKDPLIIRPLLPNVMDDLFYHLAKEGELVIDAILKLIKQKIM